MTDQRELILARLFAVVSGLSGFETAERNRIEFDDTQLPAVSVLEGDEDVPPDRLGRHVPPSGRPYLVVATPQVFVRVGGADVGSDLNAMRALIIKAVLEDIALNALTLNNGGIRYIGMQSMMHAARSMIGANAMMFEIKYLLYPNRL
jgi:hypothetical protein